MNCDKVLDVLYYQDNGEYPEGRFSFMVRFLIALHIRGCPKCAAHQKALQSASACLKEDFFPPATGIASEIMVRVRDGGVFGNVPSVNAALPLRAWLVAGLAILVSLSSASIGIDYLTPINTRTVSFMLPFGITVGSVITAFGAIFIGSHITELSKWLGLRPHE
ncbi:MAG: peptidoglycan-binding protein [Spirochaetaceae bacterium]|jgi:hypothetical protein|nr:peptidoglycan-binding protein [Spirochaetaceae bacterium]